MKFLSRAGKKIIKEAKNGLDHATGKDKIKKQYKRGVEQSHVLETEMKAKLYLQLCAEQNKIAEYRHAIQLLTQEETERFLKEQKELPKLQAEKEAAFKRGCEKIENDMQVIRAALYACITGNLSIVESLLHHSNIDRSNFFHLNPLHIAAEYNQINIINLLGNNGVNFNRTNPNGELAMDLAEIHGNEDARAALIALENRTEFLWYTLAHARKGREGYPNIMLAMDKGADINATDLDGNTALGFAISCQRDIHIIIYLFYRNKAEFNPSWSVEQKRALINKHQDAIVRSFLLEYYIETEQPLITIQKNNALLDGPQWTDTEGWNGPQYNLTIKSILVKVNGQKQVYVLGRGSTGILLQSYDFIKNNWVTHPMGPKWLDQVDNMSYYSTIRLVTACVEGRDQLFILMRQSTGIDLWRYDPHILQWTQQPSGTDWSDQNGCAIPAYYSTIRLATASVDGRDQLFVLMRQSTGIDLWRYDPHILQWTQQPLGSFGNDEQGCAAEPYYSSINLNVARMTYTGKHAQFGIANQLFVCMQNSKGIDLWRYDPFMLQWTQQPSIHHKSVPNTSILYNSTFSLISTSKGFRDLLFLLIQHGNEIFFLEYCPNTLFWKNHYRSLVYKDPSLNFFENSIQLQTVPIYVRYDTLLVSRRSKSGVEAHVYSPENKTWLRLPYNVPLTENHSYIQTHSSFMQNEYKILVLARSSNGIHCWSSNLNVYLLAKHFLKIYFFSYTHPPQREQLTHRESNAFLDTVSIKSQNFLSAAEQGNWFEMQENLSQGAYVNAVNTQGYNALQVAIIAKKLSLEMLHGLTNAGIDLENQTDSTLKTVELANQHMSEIAHLLSSEPVIGIWKSLSTSVDIAALKRSFLEHCDRAQQFLDKYPEDKLKIEAILIYYLWLSKTEPYALYVMPTLLLVSQLSAVIKKSEAFLPDDVVKYFSQKQILDAAQSDTTGQAGGLMSRTA